MTAALILAAGSISDEGGFRPTREAGGMSLIRRLIAVFRQADIKRIIVVTGFEAERVERHCAHMGAVFLRNDDYEGGDMLSSVKLGLEYLKGKCERVFITPADIPFFSAKTVAHMMGAAEAQAAIPVCGVVTGHPLLISEGLFDSILTYEGEGGLEGVLAARGVKRQFVDVEDKGVLFDFRDDLELEDLLDGGTVRNVEPDVKVWLSSGGKGFFGPGAFHLLKLTDETGSLKLACRQTGISYSKAWKVLGNIESRLGYSIIASRQGGRNGGSSEITARGRELMRRYEEFAAACDEKIGELFGQYFKDDGSLW